MHQGVVCGVALSLLFAGCFTTTSGGTSPPVVDDSGVVVAVDGPAAHSDGTLQLPGSGDGPSATQQDGGALPPHQDGGSQPPPQQDAAAACSPAASPGPSGMNKGQACLGCHASMSGSRQFTIAGSLYDAASSSTSVSGATITIHDNAGQTITLVSGTDGAFYTTQSVSFPISITASKCPDTQTMPAQSSSGDCNSCHGSGTRIHLP